MARTKQTRLRPDARPVVARKAPARLVVSEYFIMHAQKEFRPLNAHFLANVRLYTPPIKAKVGCIHTQYDCDHDRTCDHGATECEHFHSRELSFAVMAMYVWHESSDTQVNFVWPYEEKADLQNLGEQLRRRGVARVHVIPTQMGTVYGIVRNVFAAPREPESKEMEPLLKRVYTRPENRTIGHEIRAINNRIVDVQRLAQSGVSKEIVLSNLRDTICMAVEVRIRFNSTWYEPTVQQYIDLMTQALVAPSRDMLCLMLTVLPELLMHRLDRDAPLLG